MERERRTLRILLSFSPVQPISFLPRRHRCRILSSAVGSNRHRKRPMGQPDWMRIRKPRWLDEVTAKSSRDSLSYLQASGIRTSVNPRNPHAQRRKPDAAPRCASFRTPVVISHLTLHCLLRVVGSICVCCMLRHGSYVASCVWRLCRVAHWLSRTMLRACCWLSAFRCSPHPKSVPCVSCCISHVLASSCMLFAV